MARGKAANAPAVLTLLKAAFIGCVVSVALIVIFAALMWKQEIYSCRQPVKSLPGI